MRGPLFNCNRLRCVAVELCALLLVTLLAGCGGAGRRADLVFANGVEPQTLDPAIITGQPEGRIANALFEGLMRFNSQGRPEPGVAESYEISPDGKTYTFHLRKNARWSNGDPITAKDFYDSWERILNPATPAEYSYQLYYVRNAEKYKDGKVTDFNEVGVKMLDPYTLQVELENQTPFFLELCAFITTFPVHLPTVRKYGDDWLKPENIVNNGAFLMKEWKLNNRIRLQKNPNYWDQANVRLETIDVLPITKPGTAYNFYYTGVADVIMDNTLVPLGLKQELRKLPDYHTAPYLGTGFFRFNVTKKPFDDVRVRKALSLAVDKKRLVEKITRSGELPARSFVPPGIHGYTPAEGLGYDPDEARRLLAEAGYPGGVGFPLIDYQYNDNQISEGIALELKEMFEKELGINLELRKQEWKVYLTAQSRLEYDLSRSNWVGDYADPNTFLDMFITNGGNNRTGWSNKKYDELIAAAARELDPQKRFQIFQQAEKILVAEEVPICPLFNLVGVQIYDAEKIGGIEANVLDEHPLREIYRKK